MPAAGSTAPLESVWTDPETGSFVDPTALSISVYLGNTLTAGPFTAPTKLSVGHYVYEWTIPSNLAGDYSVVWTATVNGYARSQSQVIGISPVGGTPGTVLGVTVDDVADITGVNVTAGLLKQAISVVEMYASISLADFRGFNARNRFWLQKAVAYQAAWMGSQVNYMGRTSFQSQTQDGLTIALHDDDDLFLAPLAEKALSRVTWLRARSIRVMPARILSQNDGEPFGRAPGLPITDYNFENADPVD